MVCVATRNDMRSPTEILLVIRRNPPWDNTAITIPGRVEGDERRRGGGEEGRRGGREEGKSEGGEEWRRGRRGR